ncbi:MAG TPA: ribokinase [Thermomicrobiales bacterium]|nr:ribokinase [Thermomicrobiales bacterium]
MGRVLVVGGSNTDLVCRTSRLPIAGETLTGQSFSVFAGGKGANQAVAAARAGASVAFAGAVGDDEFGGQRLADLVADGVDVTCVERVAGESSGVALIVVNEHGENQIVVVPGANARVAPATIDRAIEMGSWDALLVVLEVPFDTLSYAVERLVGNATIILNAAPYDENVIELLPSVDVLVCNEIEASGLLGRAVSAGSALEDARDLRTYGSRCGVITMGTHGVFAADESGVWVTPAPRVDVVDTTGAGDAFCGALSAWIANGASVREATPAGVAAGALAVTEHGAQPSLPRREAIVSLINSKLS